MFRLQNNVPEVYPELSRDFQLFCRLYDISFNSVKQSIDSMQRITDTMHCDSVLLPLLQDKLGLFTKLDIEDRVLRYVLSAFPLIMRYKGSKQAIKYVLNLYSRIVGDETVANATGVSVNPDTHELLVYSERATQYSTLLLQLLEYVAPAGYRVKYEQLRHEDVQSNLQVSSSISIFPVATPALDTADKNIINVVHLESYSEGGSTSE